MEDQIKFCSSTSIVIGSVWCFFGLLTYWSDILDNNISDKYRLPILIGVHIAFFIFFICSFLFSYLAFIQNEKIFSEEKKKERDYQRKEKWESLQYGLNKEREENEIIKKLKDEKSALEKELKKYEDASIAERETKTQIFLLLALAFSDQKVFSDNKTIEEKVKRIEKDYELLKKTITNIKI